MKNPILLILMTSILLITCSEDNDNVEVLPESCFELPSTEKKVGDEIQFTNCSQNATLYVWTFSDGETSTQMEPTKTFDKQGNYQIKLLAGNDNNQDGILNSLDDADSLIQNITIAPNLLSVELTILSASNWTIENPGYDPVPNANVYFYQEYPDSTKLDNPDYTMTSDDEGKVRIYDHDINAVCFVVEKGEESNIVNGFLIGGVFQSQVEIDSWAQIEDATVGSYKYYDINADMRVDNNDKIHYELIGITFEETIYKNVYIGQ